MSEEKSKSNTSTYIFISIIVLCALMIGGVQLFNYVMGELTEIKTQSIAKSADSTATIKTTKHNIPLDEIYANPAYWNISWQNRGTELESTTRALCKLYYSTHTYVANQTDCNDMTCDLWDMLYAKGIASIITIGNLQLENYSIDECNHSWLIIFSLDKGTTKPGGFAVESTNGQVYFKQDVDKNSKIKRYFAGFYYSKPSDLRADFKDKW